MRDTIVRLLKESIELKQKLLKTQAGQIEAVAREAISRLGKGGRLVLFGNGGSAADAQHIAAELVHQFERRGRAIPAIALSTNTSSLTAIGNDWGFKEIFSRQVEALVESRDIVIGISTSGNSENVLMGIEEAKRRGAFTVGLLGRDGGSIARAADAAVIVPGQSTARIQECHITIGHIICHLVEQELR